MAARSRAFLFLSCSEADFCWLIMSWYFAVKSVNQTKELAASLAVEGKARGVDVHAVHPSPATWQNELCQNNQFLEQQLPLESSMK